jgi:TatD DNase family protein
MFVDSHCHLDFPDFAPRLGEVLANMDDSRVTHALCVSVDLPNFPRVLALAEGAANLYASVGVHPDYEDTEEPTVEGLVSLAAHPKVIAIGETGLDYYRLTGDLEWQRERFRTHIRAAKKIAKPLIIHTRSASNDTLRVMREEGAEAVRGVMHCFTESWEVAQAAIELGFYISLSGIVTFKNAKEIHEVARKIPLDRLLIETDSPYLAPVPHRGKTNEPAYVAHVATRIAELRGVSVESIGEATTRNFFLLFNLLPMEST